MTEHLIPMLTELTAGNCHYSLMRLIGSCFYGVPVLVAESETPTRGMGEGTALQMLTMTPLILPFPLHLLPQGDTLASDASECCEALWVPTYLWFSVGIGKVGVPGDTASEKRLVLFDKKHFAGY